MKILFISDIHGIKTNLNVIESLNYDVLVFLGDLYSLGYNQSDEVDNDSVKKFIVNNRNKLICMKGNCDQSNDYINTNIPVNDDYIKFRQDGLNIYCTHGHRYNYHKLSSFDEPGVLIYGHEHVPYIEKFNNMIYICVGSLSKPRFGSKSSYCIYENRTFTIFAVSGEVLNMITI